MKKALAVFLLTLTVLALCVTAFAADSGSITISNATIGHTYKLYKVFDATLDTSVSPAKISYTYSGTLANNDYFKQDSVGNISITDAGKDSNDPTHLSSGAVDFLKTIKGSTALRTEKATVNTVTFSGLAYGYYYVESDLGTAVTVDSTMPAAEIIDKNQGPSWTDPEATEGDPALGKHIILSGGTQATENSVNIGDTVKFEVSFNATSYVKEDKVLTYFLTDTISDTFKIDKTTLNVYFDGSKKTAGSDYTVSWNGDHTFTIAAQWKTVTEANVVIKVTYDAVLQNTAVIAKPGNPNTAYYDYRIDSDKPGDHGVDPEKPDNPPTTPYHKSEEKKTVTYTYAVGLTKIDGESKAKISGAKFSLYKGEALIKVTKTDTDGVYYYDKNGSVTELETDSSGVLVIKGLEEGAYTLKETKAPAGYNLASSGINFSLSKTDRDNYVKKHTVYFDETGKEIAADKKTEKSTKVETEFPVNVYGMVFENQRGVELPITGGIGTTIFYVAGGVLVFAALLLLITKKRMQNKK